MAAKLSVSPTTHLQCHTVTQTEKYSFALPEKNHFPPSYCTSSCLLYQCTGGPTTSFESVSCLSCSSWYYSYIIVMPPKQEARVGTWAHSHSIRSLLDTYWTGTDWGWQCFLSTKIKIRGADSHFQLSISIELHVYSYQRCSGDKRYFWTPNVLHFLASLW